MACRATMPSSGATSEPVVEVSSVGNPMVTPPSASQPLYKLTRRYRSRSRGGRPRRLPQLGPKAVSQDLLLDLGGRHRPRLYEADMARHLKGGDPRTTKGND